jgi:hypothetical protein
LNWRSRRSAALPRNLNCIILNYIHGSEVIPHHSIISSPSVTKSSTTANSDICPDPASPAAAADYSTAPAAAPSHQTRFQFCLQDRRTEAAAKRFEHSPKGAVQLKDLSLERDCARDWKAEEGGRRNWRCLFAPVLAAAMVDLRQLMLEDSIYLKPGHWHCSWAGVLERTPCLRPV